MKNFKLSTRNDRWTNAFRWARYGFSVFLVIGMLNAARFAFTNEYGDLVPAFGAVFHGFKLAIWCFLLGWFLAYDLIQYKDLRITNA